MVSTLWLNFMLSSQVTLDIGLGLTPALCGSDPPTSRTDQRTDRQTDGQMDEMQSQYRALRSLYEPKTSNLASHVINTNCLLLIDDKTPRW